MDLLSIYPSMAAQYGLPRVIAYSSSKTAIEGFYPCNGLELSGRGIRVNCIAPGIHRDTDDSKALNDDPVQRKSDRSHTYG